MFWSMFEALRRVAAYPIPPRCLFSLCFTLYVLLGYFTCCQASQKVFLYLLPIFPTAPLPFCAVRDSVAKEMNHRIRKPLVGSSECELLNGAICAVYFQLFRLATCSGQLAVSVAHEHCVQREFSRPYSKHAFTGAYTTFCPLASGEFYLEQ